MKKKSHLELHNDVVAKHGEFFCAAPFNSLHEGPDGLVSTCCKSREPIGWSNEQSFEEMYNSDHAKNVRAQFLRGEKPKQCSGCWVQEDAGKPANNRVTSNSHGYNTIDELVAATHSDGYLPIHKPEWLDLLWTNKCNFACLGCSPEISSSINKSHKHSFAILNGADPKRYGAKVTDWDNSNANKIDYILKHSDTITNIHLNGGEPFMQQDIYELLDELLKRNLHKKIEIWSHTNGSITKSYKGADIVNDYLVHWGSKAKIIMSSEGFGARGEYIRFGYKDNKWLETYNKIKGTDVKLKIQTCYNVFNALVIDEIGEWFYDNCGEQVDGSLALWTNETTSARMLHIDPLLVEAAIGKLHRTLDQNKMPDNWRNNIPQHIEWMKKQVEIADWQRKSLRDGIVELDTSRKTDFANTFPELQEFYAKL